MIFWWSIDKQGKSMRWWIIECHCHGKREEKRSQKKNYDEVYFLNWIYIGEGQQHREFVSIFPRSVIV